MDEKLILVTTPDCSFCQLVKQHIISNNLQVPVVDATEEPTRVMPFETMSVPFLAIESDDATPNSVVAVGGQACLKYLSTLEG